MKTHVHDLGSRKWPFADAENAATFSCLHVIDEGHPVLHVSHDEDDGAWQFLCGQPHIQEEARLVCLGCMVTADWTLVDLVDLPLGWGADREHIGASWLRGANPPLLEDEDAS